MLVKQPEGQTMYHPENSSPNGLRPVGWWHKQNGRIVCDLCPRCCALKDGDYGFCFVRQNVGGQMMLNTYGRSTGFCIDPVEKKPLHHFFPGSSVLSFGTAGCNLGCKFCQAWEITKSRKVLNRLSQRATPEMIAEAAVRLGCHSVAFTYNDPVIWAEYAIDTAKACHERGLKTIAVTAGYICPEPRRQFFEVMDAANVDLKGFTEHFYRHLTLSHLQPVLDTLRWIKQQSPVWLEITNLVIPGANDDPEEIRRMCRWIHANLGDDVPLHFSGFHPDFRMRNTPPTPSKTLVEARDIAIECGLNYVYLGNVHDPQREHLLPQLWQAADRAAVVRLEHLRIGSKLLPPLRTNHRWTFRRQARRLGDAADAGQPGRAVAIVGS